MKLPVLFCALLTSAGCFGAGSLHAQNPTPAASLASDPNTLMVSPTPAGTGASAVTKTGDTKAAKHERKPSAKMLEKYDTNHNGVLDPEEKAAAKKDRAAKRAEKIAKYDQNGDGKLDATEKAAMKAGVKAKTDATPVQ